jgi:hypothetical protein
MKALGRRLSLLAFVVVLLVIVSTALASPLGRSRFRATHVPPEKRKTFKEVLVWPNSYNDIPRYRYPYYDKHGRGQLVYGYGGQNLYKYSVFRPLEGFFR